MTKKCIDCGKEKPVTDFYRVFKDSEHRQSRCKNCDNAKRSGNYKRGTGVDAIRLPDGSIKLRKRA